MDQGTEPIRQDIDAIRDSMTDKMEQIESKIKGTVEDTKRMVDIKYQVSAHPWAALGTSVLIGYALGSLGGERATEQPQAEPTYRYYPSPSDDRNNNMAERSAPAQYNSFSSQPAQQPSEPGLIDQLKSQFGDELELLKGAAVATLVGLIRDTIQQNLPALQQEVERLRGTAGYENAGVSPRTYATPSARDTGTSRYYDTAETLERAVGESSTYNNSGRPTTYGSPTAAGEPGRRL